MSIVLNKHLSQKVDSKQVKNISVITLLAFLLAFFLHSQHISKPQLEQNTAGDYQDCHMCQQSADSAPKPLRLTAIIRESLALVICHFIARVDINQLYVIPQLRAPPFSL
jgi:hypothetical protein